MNDTHDGHLWYASQGELINIARIQGLGFLKAGLPKERLIKLIMGLDKPGDEDIAGSAETRKELEAYIAKHWDIVRSQLPGCNGKCTTWPCSEARHALCYLPQREGMK